MEWKDIIGYEGLYQVSNEGIVRSLDRNIQSNGCHKKSRFWEGKIIKPNIQKNGYYGVRLSKDGVIKRYLIHRLVLIAFDEFCGLEVNHIDGDKSNNRLSNLEWITHSKNVSHAYNVGLLKQKSYKVCLSKDGIDYVYDSIRKAEKELSINNLSRYISGEYKSNNVKGYLVKLFNP